VTYVINGHEFSDISTEVIGNEDRLLIDYGDTPASTLKKEVASVAKSAHQYNVGKDPAACLGNAKPTWKERLSHLF
jgi:hypothetical protein